MIVEHKGKVFQVNFIKVHRTAKRNKKKVHLIDTICTIVGKKGFSPCGCCKFGHELTSGRSNQYINDKYSKILGKKYALLDSLRFLSTVAGPKGCGEALNTKAFRTELWKKFHETFGGWR